VGSVHSVDLEIGWKNEFDNVGNAAKYSVSIAAAIEVTHIAAPLVRLWVATVRTRELVAAIARAKKTGKTIAIANASTGVWPNSARAWWIKVHKY
jgi:hypothetical protein